MEERANGKRGKNKNYFHNVAAGYFFNCLYYKKTNNTLFLWSVYRLCREENIAIPEWVYEYFDKCADKLLTDNDLPGDKVAPLCSEALGFKSLGPGTPWKEVKKEIIKSKAHRAVKDAEKASPKNLRNSVMIKLEAANAAQEPLIAIPELGNKLLTAKAAFVACNSINPEGYGVGSETYLKAMIKQRNCFMSAAGL